MNSFKEPDIFLLGAPKCGTTTMYKWLTQHSGIAKNVVKEPLYYNSFEFWDKPKNNVADYEPGMKVMDANSHNLACGFVPKRIKMRNIKNPKFIIMVRNPLERAYSNWYMRSMYRNNCESMKFEDALLKNMESFNLNLNMWKTAFNRMSRFDGINDSLNRTYIEEGLFHRNTRKYLEVFEQKSIIFVHMNELQNGQYCYNRVVDFLELGRETLNEVTPNRGNYTKPEIDHKKIGVILNMWEKDMFKFHKLTGVSLL